MLPVPAAILERAEGASRARTWSQCNRSRPLGHAVAKPQEIARLIGRTACNQAPQQPQVDAPAKALATIDFDHRHAQIVAIAKVRVLVDVDLARFQTVPAQEC